MTRWVDEVCDLPVLYNKGDVTLGTLMEPGELAWVMNGTGVSAEGGSAST